MLCSNPAMSRFTRYNIMIQFVSNLPEVGGFLQVIPIFTINKTDHHDIAEILLKVALNTISPNVVLDIQKVGYNLLTTSVM